MISTSGEFLRSGRVLRPGGVNTRAAVPERLRPEDCAGLRSDYKMGAALPCSFGFSDRKEERGTVRAGKPSGDTAAWTAMRRGNWLR